MSSTATVKNAVDTFVNQTLQTKNYNLKPRLNVKTVASNNRYGLLYFNKPWPTGATILSAKLRLYAWDAWAGSNTLTVQRLAAKFDINKVNYKNQPGVTGVTASVTQSGTAANALYEIDVTAIMQAVAAGGAWYGLRLTSPGSTNLLIHSAQSPVGAFRPALVVVWGMPPDEPDQLKPGGGRIVGTTTPFLSWDFSDPEGAGTMEQAQVQFGSSQALLDAGTTTWDSGLHDTDHPNMDLSQFANQLDNLLLHTPGGSFESGSPAGLWTANAQITGPAVGWGSTPRSGTRSMSATTIASPSGVATVESPKFPVVGGAAYGATGWFRSLGTATNWQIRIKWYDSTNTFISDSSITTGTGNTASYVQTSVTNQIAPSNATSATIFLSTQSTPGGGLTVQFDDFGIWRGVSANPFPVLVNGTQVWWRVRNVDDQGIMSPWSDSQAITFNTNGVLAITAPSGAIQEGSPTVSWSFTGRTQRSYQVIIAKTTDPNNWLWDSGKLTSNAVDVTIPFGVIKDPAASYYIWVRIWDTLAREGIPGTPAYVETRTGALSVTTGATTNVSSLAFSSDVLLPKGTLTFTRASAPDVFQLLLSDDGGTTYEFIDEALPSEITAGGTNYSWPVYGKQYVNHTYKVVAVVGGVMSSGVTTNGVIKRLCPVLMRTDFTDACFFINPERDRQRLSIQGLHERMSGPPVLVTQRIGGQGGHVKGRFVDESPGTPYTAAAMKKSFLKLEQDTGQKMLLAIANETLYIVAFNFQLDVRSDTNGIYYEAEFEWIEVGP